MKPVKNKKPEWAIQQIVRASGLIEDICEHGCGHPNKESLKRMPKGFEVHGCDGCCRGKNDKIKTFI